MRINSFKNGCDMGDQIYALLFSKILGVQHLYIDPNDKSTKFNIENMNFLLPLMNSQEYIAKAEPYLNQYYDYDYGDMTTIGYPPKIGTNLTTYHASKFNIAPENIELTQPWLSSKSIEDSYFTNKKITINRTARYHSKNDAFYYHFLQCFDTSHLLFLGLESEYLDFTKTFDINIDFVPTKSSILLMEIINSVPSFLGNQSLICSIATGLGKNCFIEVGYGCANYLFNRANIQYFH